MVVDISRVHTRPPPSLWTSQALQAAEELLLTTPPTPKKKRSIRRRRSSRRKVQFNEEGNQYYDNKQVTKSQVQNQWYNVEEYNGFRQEQRRTVLAIRNNGLIWMDPHSLPATLLRVYTALRLAKTVQEVEPVWNITKIRHHPGLVGLERSSIQAIPLTYLRARDDCMAQIYFLQRQNIVPREREALIRAAARQHSRASRLYARYVGALVAAMPV